MYRAVVAVLCTIAMFAIVVAASGPARPALAAAGTTLVNTYPGGSMVVEEPLYAHDLSLSTSYRVFLPPGYADDGRRYPVLYMLHGVAGDSSEWQSIGLLEAADRMIVAHQIEPLVIVLPNGGANYWVNHGDGARWGDYLTDDVVPSVDSNFRTITDRSARAVGGLSMGGEGALRLAMLNPDVFGIAAAHSPSLRTAYDQLAPELQELYGTSEQWRAGSPLWLTMDSDAAYRLNIALDVGEDDPWRPNVEMLHNWMTNRGIAHQFDVLPGDHDADYWIEYVDRYLTFYSGAFENHPVAQAAVGAL